jgi:hypothetical protein
MQVGASKGGTARAGRQVPEGEAVKQTEARHKAQRGEAMRGQSGAASLNRQAVQRGMVSQVGRCGEARPGMRAKTRSYRQAGGR